MRRLERAVLGLTRALTRLLSAPHPDLDGVPAHGSGVGDRGGDLPPPFAGARRDRFGGAPHRVGRLEQPREHPCGVRRHLLQARPRSFGQ
jgi:hypothetical protein